MVSLIVIGIYKIDLATNKVLVLNYLFFIFLFIA